MNVTLIVLTITALGLQIADVVTTLRILDKGGEEHNPLMSWMMGWAGNAWWAVKLGLFAVIAGLALFVMTPASGAILMGIACAYGLFTLWYNLRSL